MFNFIDNFLSNVNVNVTGVKVHTNPNFLLTVTVITAIGRRQGLLDDFLNGLLRQIFLLGDRPYGHHQLFHI